MSFFSKQTKNLLLPFKKLFAFPKQKNRRVVFFVLATLFFSFSYCLAAVTYTQSQIDILKTDAYKLTDSEINNLQSNNVSYDSFVKEVADYGKGWTQSEAAEQVYKNKVNSTNTGTDVGGHVNIGDNGENWLVTAALAPVIGVLSVIAYCFKYLLSWSGAALDLTLNPNLYNFTSNTMITQGWTTVRDVCNLFFLLILLFIAICTILKIEKYHAKKTLLMLIIIALLINFSKPIAIFVFDGSQLLMNTFLNNLNGNQQTASTMYMKSSEIANAIYDKIPKYSDNANSSAELVLIYFFSIIFIFMLLVAFLVLAIFLIIRIVAIMVLIIVSPFAFFASAVPDFNKMASSWWNALFKYSYFGPAAAFFLLIGTKLQSSLPNLGSITITGYSSKLTAIASNMVQYFVVIVFLYAAVIMGQQFGIQFASGVTKWADRSLKGGWFRKGGWPREIGAWGARTTGAADVYKGVKKGISQRPGFSWLDKESWEKKSKARQEKWEGKVAPFNIAAARKKAKDRENDSEKDILRDAAAGKQDAIIVASKKGFSKDNNGNDLWTNPNVIRALENEELRKEAYGNLRDKGKTNSVIDGEIARQNIAADKQKIEGLYNEELGKLSSNNLGKQDLGSLAVDTQTNPVGKQWIENRLKEFDDIDSRLISNMLSGGHSKNVAYIRDLRAQGKLDTPLRNNQQSNQSAGNSQTGGYQSSGYGP
jgi:hypothetical protein